MNRPIFDPNNKGPILGPIPQWSHSRIKVYEECPYRAEAQFFHKEDGFEFGGESAERGIRIHEALEKFVQGESDILPSVNNQRIKRTAERLREFFKAGKVRVEEKWGFTIDLDECDFFAKDLWARIILDVLYFESETSARVIDWKTGKASDVAKFKYADQMNTYAIMTFVKYPDLEFVQSELHFTDKDSEPLAQRYTREQGMALLPRLRDRALNLTTATFFPPQPSKHNCRFCPKAENASCDWRYEE